MFVRTAVLILGMWSLLLGGCTAHSARSQDEQAALADEVPPEPQRPVLRVGVAQTAPPIIFMQDGQPAGLEADLARELAAALDRDLKFVPIYWDALFTELIQERIDIIMAGVTVTPDREQKFAFADPYLDSGQQALIRTADSDALGTQTQVLITTQRVGVENASAGERYARRNLRQSEIFRLPTLDAAVASLRSHEVSVVIHDSPCVQWYAREDADLTAVAGLLTQEQLAWPMRKDDEALLAAVNEVLRVWRANGQLNAIIDRWLQPPGEQE